MSQWPKNKATKAKDKSNDGKAAAPSGARSSTSAELKGTLRRKWWPEGFADAQEIVDEAEYGWAGFSLLAEHSELGQGRYQIKLQVVPKSPEVLARVRRHGLEKTEIHIDRDAKAIEERRKDLEGRMSEEFGADGLTYLWSHRPLVSLAQQAVAWIKGLSTVHITFGTLLDGLVVSGNFEEARRLVREVTMGIDKVAAQLSAAEAFEEGITQVYAPGTKMKAGKDKGTPPSKWGR